MHDVTVTITCFLDDPGGKHQMITVRKGDLFESGAQTLVNSVNCVGVMGKGVALEFRKRFPDMYADYLQRCNADMVRLGQPYLFRRLLSPWILNFPTKDHWRSVAKLSDIVAGLEYLARHYKEWGIQSLAVPPLGCGEGRLDWRIVGPTFYRQLAALDIDVELYAPFDVPDEQATVDFLRVGADEGITSSVHLPRLAPAAVALAAIVNRGEIESWQPVIERVADLFLRVSTRQAEVLASVHYVAIQLCELSKSRRLAKPTEAKIVEDVMEWKLHRRPSFSELEVVSAVRGLNVLGWLDVIPTAEFSIEPELEVAI